MVGAVAQLGEHLLCKQGVSGSIPLSSTKSIGVETDGICLLKKYKFCIGFEPDACSAYIVKRRLIWRLPGVLHNPMDCARCPSPVLLKPRMA